MLSAYKDRVLPLRLERGEEVHSALLRVCTQHSVNCGFLLSGIGMLADPELGFLIAPGDYQREFFGGNYELLQLTGNISLKDGQPFTHLHVTLGRSDFGLLGGHLFSARVAVTVEALILVLPPELQMWREPEADTGLPGLRIAFREGQNGPA